MRRAEWRRRADDPIGLFGWWWRGVVEAGWPFYILLIPVSFAPIWNHPLFVMLPMWAVIAATWLRRKWTPDLLGPLLPDPAPPGQVRASVCFRRRGLTTGSDEMALVVVEGWLYAEGVRSHFALRRQDVREMATASDRKGWTKHVDGSEIRLSGIGDPARIVLERWRCRPTLIEGEPTFPPARVHPREFARWQAWSMAGAMIWPVLNFGGALVSSGAEGRLGLMLLGLAVGGFVAAVGAVRFRRLLRIEAWAKGARTKLARPSTV